MNNEFKITEVLHLKAFKYKKDRICYSFEDLLSDSKFHKKEYTSLLKEDREFKILKLELITDKKVIAIIVTKPPLPPYELCGREPISKVLIYKELKYSYITHGDFYKKIDNDIIYYDDILIILEISKDYQNMTISIVEGKNVKFSKETILKMYVENRLEKVS